MRRELVRSLRTVCSPAGLRGTGVELAWLAAHAAMYPMGIAGERGRHSAAPYSLGALPPRRRGLMIGDVEAAGTPILLVHGLVDNRSIFARLRRSLRRRGFGRVYTMNYSVFTGDVRSAAHALAVEIDEICASTGYERIHVVGHSLGGLIARYYVQRLAGDARVHTLATLGTPHSGTHAARLLPQRIVRELRPGSRLLAELTQPAPECRTRFLAVYSDLDQLIVPQRSARLDHPDLTARNVLVRGIGHLSLPVDGRVIHEIVTAFADLGADGSAQADDIGSPVTPIGAGASARRRSPAGRGTATG